MGENSIKIKHKPSGVIFAPLKFKNPFTQGRKTKDGEITMYLIDNVQLKEICRTQLRNTIIIVQKQYKTNVEVNLMKEQEILLMLKQLSINKGCCWHYPLILDPLIFDFIVNEEEGRRKSFAPLKQNFSDSLFMNFCGVSPKDYLQHVSLSHERLASIFIQFLWANLCTAMYLNRVHSDMHAGQLALRYLSPSQGKYKITLLMSVDPSHRFYQESQVWAGKDIEGFVTITFETDVFLTVLDWRNVETADHSKAMSGLSSPNARKTRNSSSSSHSKWLGESSFNSAPLITKIIQDFTSLVKQSNKLNPNLLSKHLQMIEGITSSMGSTLVKVSFGQLIGFINRMVEFAPKLRIERNGDLDEFLLNSDEISGVLGVDGSVIRSREYVSWKPSDTPVELQVPTIARRGRPRKHHCDYCRKRANRMKCQVKAGPGRPKANPSPEEVVANAQVLEEKRRHFLQRRCSAELATTTFNSEPIADLFRLVYDSLKVYVDQSLIPGAGLGVFAACDLYNGEQITEYFGSTDTDPASLNFQETHLYSVTRDGKIRIDGIRWPIALHGVGSLINSSLGTGKDCNCEIKRTDSMRRYIHVLAGKTIKKGEELLSKYRLLDNTSYTRHEYDAEDMDGHGSSMNDTSVTTQESTEDIRDTVGHGSATAETVIFSTSRVDDKPKDKSSISSDQQIIAGKRRTKQARRH